MPRYNAAELARAVAAGVPRGAATFADDDAWHEYQEQWLSVFAPGEQLPPVGDQHRRTRWKAVARQHKKMTAQLESDGMPIVVASSVAPVASSASAPASSAAAAASSASVASSSASSAADSSEAAHPITSPMAAPVTTKHVASAASSSAAAMGVSRELCEQVRLRLRLAMTAAARYAATPNALAYAPPR